MSSALLLHSPLLQAVIAEVCHVDARSMDGHVLGPVEFARTGTFPAECLERLSTWVEHPHLAMPKIRAVDPPNRVDAHAGGDAEPESSSEKPPPDDARGLALDEALQPMVVGVRYPQRAVRPDCRVRRVMELPVPEPSGLAERVEAPAVRPENQNIVPVEVCDVQVAALVHRNSTGRIQALRLDVANETAIQLEHRDSVVVVFGDVQELVRPYAEVHGPIQLPRSFAFPAEGTLVLAVHSKHGDAVRARVCDEDVSRFRDGDADRPVQPPRPAVAGSVVEEIFRRGAGRGCAG